MDVYEVFGTLTFPSKKARDAWMDDPIAPESCAIFAKIVLPPEDLEPLTVEEMFAAYENETDVKIRVELGPSNAFVSMFFDDALLLEHGPTILGALAQARHHGAEGTLYIVSDMWLMNELALKKGTAKLTKPKKRTRAASLPGAKEHHARQSG